MFIFYYIVLHATLHYIIRYFHFLPHSRSLNFCIIQTTSQLILSNNLEGNRGREGLLCAMRFVYSVISLFLDGHWIRLPTHLVCMDDQWEPMHIMWLIPVSDQIASLHVHYYSAMKLRGKKLTVLSGSWSQGDSVLMMTAGLCNWLSHLAVAVKPSAVL